MFQTKIVEEGSKSYYDDIPRYKNPYEYSEEIGDSNDCFELWNEGWDKASENHTIFTENQQLKAEQSEWKVEKESYVDAVSMGQTIIKIQEQKIAKLKESLEVEVADLRDKLDTIDELAHSLIGYINETNKLLFSREKMISMLKLMFSEDSPEVKKKKPN